MCSMREIRSWSASSSNRASFAVGPRSVCPAKRYVTFHPFQLFCALDFESFEFESWFQKFRIWISISPRDFESFEFESRFLISISAFDAKSFAFLVYGAWCGRKRWSQQQTAGFCTGWPGSRHKNWAHRRRCAKNVRPTFRRKRFASEQGKWGIGHNFFLKIIAEAFGSHFPTFFILAPYRTENTTEILKRLDKRGSKGTSQWWKNSEFFKIRIYSWFDFLRLLANQLTFVKNIFARNWTNRIGNWWSN